MNDALDIAFEDVRTIIDHNLMTCILVTRAVVPEMLDLNGAGPL